MMGETTGGSANCKGDSAGLEAAYTWLTPSPFLTSGSGPHKSPWAECFLPSYVRGLS